MTESQPTIARRNLGRALQRHRKLQGLNRTQAGKALDYSIQTMTRIEEGTQATRSLLVEKLCELYGIDDEEMSHLTSLASRGKERGWWEPYFDVGSEETSRPKIPLFLEVEQTARKICVIETEVVPGLLQTSGYLTVLQEAHLPMPKNVSERWQGLRTRRQELLYGRTPFPTLEFIIGRAAIDYLYAMEAGVRDAQIRRLREVSAMRNVTIRILTQLHAASAGGFNIPYPGDGSDPFVFMDASDGCRYIEDRRIVSMFEQTFVSARPKSIPLEEYLR